MKRLLILVVLGWAVPVFAQTATPTNHLNWLEVGQAVSVASAATYNYYVDGATTATGQLTGVTCVASGSDASCTSNFPSFTPGNHTMTVSQVINGAESAKSAPPLGFTFVVVVTPTNLRVVP